MNPITVIVRMPKISNRARSQILWNGRHLKVKTELTRCDFVACNLFTTRKKLQDFKTCPKKYRKRVVSRLHATKSYRVSALSDPKFVVSPRKCMEIHAS